MKKILLFFLCASAVFADRNSEIFTGVWCVEKENMNITFIGKDSVSFSASDDESINGNGRFSFNDSLLVAELNNSGMKMKITYKYKETNKGVTVITQSLLINGDAINANPDPIFLTRCMQNSKRGNK